MGRDAQTEARAIAQRLQDVVDGTDGWLNVDKAAGIIANALAEKDVEMAKLELERDKWEQHACTGDDVLARTRSKLERAEAQLAEARKALDALGAFAFWFQKYPEFTPNPDMQAEMLADLDRARPFIPARRALEAQGGGDER